MNESPPLRRWRASNLRLLRGLLASAVILYLILTVSWIEIRSSLRAIDTVAILSALISFVALNLFEAERLKAVLGHGVLDRLSALRCHIIGVYYATFLPGQVGGEIYRVQHLRRLGIPTSRAIPLLLVSRALGMTVTVVACSAILLLSLGDLARALRAADQLFGLRFSATTFVSVGLATIVILLLVFLLRRNSELGPRLVAPTRLFASRAAAALRSVDGPLFLTIALWSTVLVGVRGMTLDLLVTSVNADIQLWDAIMAAGLGMIAGVLPITPGGLGLREGAISGALVMAGVPYSTAFLVALLSRSMSLLVVAAGAVASLVDLPSPPIDRDETASSRGKTPS